MIQILLEGLLGVSSSTIFKGKGYIQLETENDIDKVYEPGVYAIKGTSYNVTLAQNLSRNPTVGTLQKIADVIGCKVGDFFVDDMDIKDDANTITCPHCGGKIHFDGEPHMPEHKNIRGKEYYK